MPVQTTCPSCGRKLRVPEHLTGRRVKCPSCQETFQSKPDEEPARGGYYMQAPAQRPKLEDEWEASRRGRTPYDDRNDDRDYERRRSRYDDDDDRDEFRDEERRRKRQKRRAREMCLIPGILYIVLSAINIAGMGLSILGNAVDLRTGQGDEDTGPAIVLAGMSLIASLVVLIGGIQMIRLQTWGVAMAASVLCVIPVITPCCMLGIPFGVWGIIVLCNNRVKESFS